jgi:transcriptional regulator GlxA family with amidase domain
LKITFLLFDGVTALDVVGPFESLVRIVECDIAFAAKTSGRIRTGDGFLGLHADVSIADVSSTDILILPGGHPDGLRATMLDTKVLTAIKRLDKGSQLTCSVCTGSLILAAAGLLKGRQASTHWRAKNALGRYGAIYSSRRVTRDGKFLTSAGVSAGIDMGLMLCEEVAGREVAEAIELSMQYDAHPPFGTGDPETSATPERIKLIETVLRQ